MNGFNQPVMKSKQTLFGRKLVLHDTWKELIKYGPDYKAGIQVPCWGWFGGPPDLKNDWK